MRHELDDYEWNAIKPMLPTSRRRAMVERCFNKINHCRRLATRYHMLAANYLAFVQPASIGYGCALMSLRPNLRTARADIERRSSELSETESQACLQQFKPCRSLNLVNSSLNLANANSGMLTLTF